MMLPPHSASANPAVLAVVRAASPWSQEIVLDQNLAPRIVVRPVLTMKSHGQWVRVSAPWLHMPSEVAMKKNVPAAIPISSTGAPSRAPASLIVRFVPTAKGGQGIQVVGLPAVTLLLGGESLLPPKSHLTISGIPWITFGQPLKIQTTLINAGKTWIAPSARISATGAQDIWRTGEGGMPIMPGQSEKLPLVTIGSLAPGMHTVSIVAPGSAPVQRHVLDIPMFPLVSALGAGISVEGLNIVKRKTKKGRDDVCTSKIT